MFWTTATSKKKATKKADPRRRPSRPPKGQTENRRVKDAERKRRESLKRRDVPVPPCEDPERRKRLEADDAAWLRWYFGADCPNPFSRDFTPDQLVMIAAVRTGLDSGGDQAIAAPRGEGKSSIVERLGLKYSAEGRCDFLVIFGATGTAAEQALDSIKEDIATNDRLLADYPELCVPVRALENTPNRAHYQTVSGARHDNGQAYVRASSRFVWCGNEIVFPDVPGSPARRAVIATRGLEAAVRGLKRKGKRPRMALIDDPDTETTSESEAQATKLEKRIDKGIGGLGSQTKPISRVMLTTLQSRKSVSYRYTDPKQKSSWNGIRQRTLQHKPTREDLWLEYVAQRQLDQQNGDREGRTAHAMYVANRAVMDAGAQLSNPYRYDGTLLADGTQRQLSALQRYYDEVARIGAEAVATELDNDPPAEDQDVDRLVLSAHRIQHQCLSGLDRRVVPAGTKLIVRAADVKKIGLHHVTLAFDADARGSVIDYDFFEFSGAAGRAAKDCELIILEGLWDWHTALQELTYEDQAGEIYGCELTLIDAGWKDESWAGQPVQAFCSALGNREFVPSKGMKPYHRPNDSRRIAAGDNWHIAYPRGTPLVEMNSDHWKLKVHEAWLAEPGAPGSLTLFSPPLVEGRSQKNAHLGFAKHQTAEHYETRPAKGFRAPQSGWFGSSKPNHWFDATYMAFVAKSIKGISALAAASAPPRATPAARPPDSTSQSHAPTRASAPDSSSRASTPRRRISFRR